MRISIWGSKRSSVSSAECALVSRLLSGATGHEMRSRLVWKLSAGGRGDPGRGDRPVRVRQQPDLRPLLARVGPGVSQVQLRIDRPGNRPVDDEPEQQGHRGTDRRDLPGQQRSMAISGWCRTIPAKWSPPGSAEPARHGAGGPGLRRLPRSGGSRRQPSEEIVDVWSNLRNGDRVPVGHGTDPQRTGRAARPLATPTRGQTPPILGFLNADYSLERVDAMATDRRCRHHRSRSSPRLTAGHRRFVVHVHAAAGAADQRLIAGTKRIAANQLDFRFDQKRNDEIGVLEESFNTMTARIQAHRDELRERQGVPGRDGRELRRHHHHGQLRRG